jgi:HEAT repeat protein
LIAGAIARMPRLLAANLTSMLKRRVASEPMLILIDGWDELSAEERANAGAWLAALLKALPTHRCVVAAATHNYAELHNAGFACLSLAPLNAHDAQAFTRRWTHLANAGPGDATLLFEAMQQPPGRAPRPLDFTLAASVWHKRGVMPLNLIAVYDRWLDDALEDAGVADYAIARAFLNRVAWTMFTQHRTSLTRGEIDVLAAQLLPQTDQSGKTKDVASAILNHRVLFAPQASELAFVHPRIAAYLVAQYAAQSGGAIEIAAHVDHPWYEDAAYFFAGLGDAAPLVDAALSASDDVFHSALTRLGRWASLAPDNVAWRKRILGELSRVLTAPETPLDLRERVMRTVLATRDQGVNYLFKQMTGHKESYLRRPGVQAFGLMRRESDAALVAGLLQDPEADVRLEALRVLGQIGGATAVDALAQVLLDAEDEMRRAAAEALAECGQAGWDLLSEGAQLKDDQGADLYRVRRAACYGLARVNQPWALDILTRLMREDKQWIVRSGAEDALSIARGDLTAKDEQAFKLDLTPIDPDNIGWLIEWGAARGESIGPGAPSRRALQRALEDDAVKVRVAAANTYAYIGDGAAVNALRQRLHDPEPEVRDAAYRALLHIAQRTNQRITA